MWSWVTACRADWRTAVWAFLASLGAVASFAVLVVGLGWLLEPEKLWHEEGVSIIDCLPVGSQAFTLLRRELMCGPIVHTDLANHELVSSEPRWQIPWPKVHPYRIASTPKGERLIFGMRDGSIYSTVCMSDAKPTFLGRHAELDTLDLACSTDGKKLVSLGWHSVNLWDLTSASLRWRRDDLPANCSTFDIETGHIVCGLRYGHIVELSAETGHTIRECIPLVGGVREIEIDTQGQRLACVADDNAVLVFHWPEFRLAWRSNKSERHVGGGSFSRFSADGERLVTASPENLCCLAIWDVKTGRRVGDLKGHTEALVGGRFLANGRFMSWGTDGTIRIWNIDRQTTERVVSLIGQPRTARSSPLFASAARTVTQGR